VLSGNIIRLSPGASAGGAEGEQTMNHTATQEAPNFSLHASHKDLRSAIVVLGKQERGTPRQRFSLLLWRASHKYACSSCRLNSTPNLSIAFPILPMYKDSCGDLESRDQEMQSDWCAI